MIINTLLFTSNLTEATQHKRLLVQEQSLALLGACLENIDVASGVLPAEYYLSLKSELEKILTNNPTQNTKLLAINCAQIITAQVQPSNYLA